MVLENNGVKARKQRLVFVDNDDMLARAFVVLGSVNKDDITVVKQ